MNAAARARANSQGSKNVLSAVNVGDEVMKTIYDRDTHTKPERYIFYRVTKVTAKRVCCGITEYDKDTGVAVVNKGSSHRVTPLNDAARTWRDEQKRKGEARDAEQRAYREREDVQLANRLSNLEVERLLALGIDKLKRMVAILDEKPATTPKPVAPCPSCGDTVGVCECA